MKKLLPILIILLLVGGAFFKLSTVFAAQEQDSNLQISDFALDIQNGEKDNANDVDAQNNQQDVSQGEQAEAAADNGDPSTGLTQATLDEAVAPEEAQESAKLVENPQATTSENDSGEVLKDQSTQAPSETPNHDVNTQDDNKAPITDPDTQPQATQAPEQPMENIQQLPAAEDQSQNQPYDTSKPSSNDSNQGETQQQ